MSEDILLGLAAIIVLGMIAQWLSWRLGLPAILMLLLFGLFAGPVSGRLKPDEIFGPLLLPLVSVSVAVILFEGGMSLKISELRRGGGVVRNLVTVGVVITWLLGAISAHYIAGLPWAPALLIGAILVVSGPTVIMPLLRQIRPSRRVGSIIKWEGIVNDPIGALLAVVVFEAIVAGAMADRSEIIVAAVMKAVLFGAIIGAAGAGLVILMIRRYLVPDFLHNPIALMLIILCYVSSNLVQTESGLLAVTIMGVVLGNQKLVSVRHIVEFKENLQVLLIGGLFIILAARIPPEQLALADISGWLYVAVLIFFVRPVMVLVSTLGSSLNWREKLFLAWMAPRGIVAAAITAVFAIALTAAGFEGGERMIVLSFQVIIGTVAVYGLSAAPLARYLALAKPDPQGVLFAGAQYWVRQIALFLKENGFEVALVDSNWSHIAEARKAGISAYYGSVLSEELLDQMQLDGIGRLMAMTPNDEVNSLAALHLVGLFGSKNVYQLRREDDEGAKSRLKVPRHLRGRYLFSAEATHTYLDRLFRQGKVIKKSQLSKEYTFGDFMDKYGPNSLPLFIITENGQLKVIDADSPETPHAGQVLISLVDPIDTAH